MRDRTADQVSAGLLGAIAGMMCLTADVFAAARARLDFGPDPLAVAGELGLELTLIVVRRNHHVASLSAFGIESVMVDNPSPHGVVLGIHLPHVDNLTEVPSDKCFGVQEAGDAQSRHTG
ncbi:MAG: hypothetical protein ACRDV3_02805 [Acidothermaceae bacterium]